MLLIIAGCETVPKPPGRSQEREPVVTPAATPDRDSTDSRGEFAPGILTELSDPQPKVADNSIDMAFDRIIAERREELEDNTILAYLYALKWHNEYAYLSGRLFDEVLNRSWPFFRYDYRLVDTAIEYAGRWSESNLAIAQFEGIARCYKLLVYDCLERFSEHGVDMDLQTNEEELYLYLSDVYYMAQIPDDLYFCVLSIMDDASNPMPVYAALPDDDIHLAFAAPFGAVLSIGGEERFYPWSNGRLTPRSVLPVLSLYDYNGDGVDELAIILYGGSGTSFSVSELHIIDLYGNKEVTTVNYETFQRLLFHRLSASYDPGADELTIRLDDQEVVISFDASWIVDEPEMRFWGLDLSSIIHFYAEDGTLSVIVWIGGQFYWATPEFVARFYADIVYDGPSISLANCRLVEDQHD